ncbi:DUF1800 family protein [Candidatus Gracilibacteria bacterium]|nr:DUF1800 family protein [Candidatus Gracilibacteria bacterium]
MNKKFLFKKFLSFFVIVSILSNLLVPVYAVSTNGSANPWTMEKAEHLAKRALFGVSPQTVLDLYNAGSATNAVNLLFPSVAGPDRTQYNQELTDFKGTNFNSGDTNTMRKLYAFKYYRDPYEAKMKLFSMFEDHFSLDRTGAGSGYIDFPDVENHFDVLQSETLGNFKRMVKKVLFDTTKPQNSYAMGKYLDLLNGPNKNSPNENYARELLQLFLMLEYKPWEDAETVGAERNYSEADVAALAKILTGFRANGGDKVVYFDYNYHNTGSAITFLTGSLKSGDNFPFYNTASGTIDNNLIISSINGNNGLADNTIDYIFSKREAEIADFLAWKMLRHYVQEKPTQSQIETLASVIISNNFDIYPSVKYLLASDMMYSETSMNSLKYKNPLEIAIGTLKLLHYKNPNVIDPLVNDTTLLTTLGWTPYYPGSIFGRDGFDNNLNFMNAYFHNQWSTYTSKIAFTSGTGYYDLAELIPVTTKTNTGTIAVKTSTGNTYSGSINLSNISITLNENAFEGLVVAPALAPAFFSVLSSDFVEETGTGDIDTGTGTIDTGTGEKSTGTTETGTGTGDTGLSETPQIIFSVSSNEFVEKTDQTEETSTGSTDTSTGTTEETPKVPEVPEIPPAPETPQTTEIPPVTEYSTGTTDSPIGLITDKLLSFLIPTANAGIVNNNTITFETGTVVFPDFYILTNSGNIINLEGTYDSLNGNLSIASGSMSFGTGFYTIASSSFTINPEFNLTRDITTDEMIIELEDYLYLGKRLPTSVKDEIKNYLLKNEAGVDRNFLPNNTAYRNKYIKAVISMMLTQPEYIMLSGYDQAETIENSGSNPINDASKKLIMIELYGGYDWMNGVIPKSDFAYYQNIRGGLAIDPSNLVDLGSVYLNKNLEKLKPYYDNGELRIVNRVGAPSHSRGHDTAAIQVASQKALQTVGTPGLIGELIKNESNYLNNIVLGTSRPPIYTNGRYINIGGSSIMYKNNLSTLNTAEKTQQVNSLRNILKNRNYPLTTKTVFNNSTILDDVAKSGQESVGYTLSGRLNFTNNLMMNNLGITYYVPGGGGYDTHGDQLKSGVYNLNDRTRDLVSDITYFFDKAKATGKDVTIVVYSEFGRTLKANGTIGTDHGEGGGYFILTSNNSLKTALPDKVIGKLSPEKEIDDWFGTGIDYRSIYSKILTSLYNIDATNYFFAPYRLDDDLNTTIPNPVFLRREVRHSSTNSMNLDFKFMFEDKNYLPKNASYIKFYSGEDPNNLKLYSRWNIENYSLQKDGSYKVNFNLTKLRNYYYKIEIVDNQYDTYTATGSFVVPNKFESNSTNQVIPLDTDSLFAKYNNTQVTGNTSITKLTLYDNSGTTVTNSGITTFSGSFKTIPFSGGINMTFGTGETSISTLTNSGVWNGGFVLPKFINKNEFFSEESVFNGQKLKNLNVEKLLKVGADTLGVGMQLNQDVKIEIPVSNTTGTYKIVTSEDGLNWTELARKNETVLSGSTLGFYTNKFSYFALVEGTNTVDTTPDNFVFNDLGSQELNTSLTSNEITVTGINTGVTLSISVGEYSLNNGTYSTANVVVNNGDKIKLRRTSSTNYNTSVNTILTISGVSDTWTITTKQQSGTTTDSTPYSFVFNDLSNQELSTSLISNEITVSGINTGVTLSINGGEYSLNNGAYSTANVVVNNGDKIKLRNNSSASYSTTTNNILTIGGVSDTWYITTKQQQSSGGGGGGGGGGSLSKDYCPGGDYSKSYYDKTCGKKPATQTGTTVDDKKDDDKKNDTGNNGNSNGNTTQEKNNDIDKLINHDIKPITYKDRYGNTYTAKKMLNGRYVLFNANGTYVNKMFLKQYDIIKYLKTVKKSTKVVKNDDSTDTNYQEKPEDAKIMDSFKPIVFFSRYNERYKAVKTIDGRYILIREDGTYIDRFFRKQFEIITYLK